MAEPTPFGFMLRKPGPRVEENGFEQSAYYSAPDFATPGYSSHDPRWSTDVWSLSLPHQCQEWEIWDGPREDVLDAAKRFRAELDAAIAVLEAADE